MNQMSANLNIAAVLIYVSIPHSTDNPEYKCLFFFKSCDLFSFIINNTIVVYGFASRCYIKDFHIK